MSSPMDSATLSALVEAMHGVRLPPGMAEDTAAELARLAAAAKTATAGLRLEDEAAGFLATLDALADDGWPVPASGAGA